MRRAAGCTAAGGAAGGVPRLRHRQDAGAAPAPGLAAAGAAVQRRTHVKLASASMKGKPVNHGLGGPLSKRYGWRVYPGNIVGPGYTIYKVRWFNAVSVDDDDDEMPFTIYPGANTIRTYQGDIRSTCEGVVRVSKLPGTEGTGEKVFLWVDPFARIFYEREARRHSHRELNREFRVDEIEDRSLHQPSWTEKGEYNREEETPEWPSNPEWDMPEGERDYSMRPIPAKRAAETDWERNERADKAMFWDQMPRRERHYTFGGQTFAYEGARVEPKPLETRRAWEATQWSYSGSYSRLYDPWHRREDPRKGIYTVSDSWGTSWN